MEEEVVMSILFFCTKNQFSLEKPFIAGNNLNMFHRNIGSLAEAAVTMLEIFAVNIDQDKSSALCVTVGGSSFFLPWMSGPYSLHPSMRPQNLWDVVC